MIFLENNIIFSAREVPAEPRNITNWQRIKWTKNWNFQTETKRHTDIAEKTTEAEAESGQI